MIETNDDVNPYLQQEVLSASPARLRWLLIQRAQELCSLVDQLWQDEQFDTARQWMLRIREILEELLAGITSGENPLAQTVADFYVFLLKLALQADLEQDIEKLNTLRSLLEIESETWQLVVQRLEATGASDDVEADLGDGSDQAAAEGQAAPIPPLSGDSNVTDGGFSLEI